MIPTPEQAWDLLCEYNEGEFHRKHGRTVGDVLRWFAQEEGFGGEADFWEAVGILHDLDFEQWPDQHCVKCQELMRERGIDESLIRAAASHGYGQPAANFLSLNFFFTDLTSRSATLLEGRMRAAAPNIPGLSGGAGQSLTVCRSIRPT